MSLRLKIGLIALGVVLLLAITYGVSVFMSRDTTQTTSTTEPTQTPPASTDTSPTDTTSPDTTPETPVTSAPALKPAEADLIVIATPFVERMGSYSNQGGSDNLQMLLPFMTSTMKSWAIDRINQAKTKEYEKIYTGVTSTVLSYKIATLNTSDAQINMTTQRKESVGSTSNTKVYNQDVVVNMVKEGGVWLVDAVDWK